MNLFVDAFRWIFAPERFTGDAPLQVNTLEHLWFTLVSVLIAAVIAIPTGFLIGHTGRGREIAVAISGAARALPSLGLTVLLVLVIGVVHKTEAAVISFVLLAIPSILAGAYTGVEAVDRRVVDAARAVGMTEWQIFARVELPLALPLLIGGIRSAAVQVVATVTIAAYVGLGGLGYYIIQGVSLRRFDQILGGSILVVAVAILVDLALALVQRLVVPRGVAIAGHSTTARVRRRRGAGASTATGTTPTIATDASTSQQRGPEPTPADATVAGAHERNAS